MIVFPNAKINLGLRITRRRPDGYHDIESLMVPVQWCDVLEAVPGRGDAHSLTVTGRGVAVEPEANLVMKAVRALERRTGAPLPPLDIFLRKIIPDGAGMGGGSADASFMLRVANTECGLGLNDDELASVASEIGADCPFFIYNNVARATGTGTTLTPAPDAEAALRALGLTIVIAKPGEGVSTRGAYAGVTPAPLTGRTPVEIVAQLPPEEWEAAGLINDFERSVMSRRPSIAAAKEVMTALGAAYAAMTGSGSAVFGLFRDGGDKLADKVREAFAGCDTMVSPLL